MDSKELKSYLQSALSKNFKNINKHINGLSCGRYGGIESKFENAFFKEVGRGEKNVSCHDVGTDNYFPDRGYGFLDFVIRSNEDYEVGVEFKAVRMPRKKADCLFDISQLSSDFLRLAKAKKLGAGWVVAFVYGPMVDDATSGADLLRRFQNQMYLEYQTAKVAGLMKNLTRDHADACDAIGWNLPTQRAANTEKAFGVLVKEGGRALGAVAIEAK